MKLSGEKNNIPLVPIQQKCLVMVADSTVLEYVYFTSSGMLRCIEFKLTSHVAVRTSNIYTFPCSISLVTQNYIIKGGHR